MGLLEFHREGHSQMTLKERRCVLTEGSPFKEANGAFEVRRVSGPRSRGQTWKTGCRARDAGVDGGEDEQVSGAVWVAGRRRCSL